jgi:cob(I)alamin adenosyltransferase
MAKIYTRTGDGGMTGLVGGGRITKASLPVPSIGTADEFNAHIGDVRSSLDIAYMGDEEMDRVLLRVQKEAFELGAVLALDKRPVPDHRWMEKEIDQFEGELEPLKAFILPGGSPTACKLQIARAVARRLERSMVPMTDGPFFLDREALKWVNRVSDLLFVMARYANRAHDYPETKWVPEPV